MVLFSLRLYIMQYGMITLNVEKQILKSQVEYYLKKEMILLDLLLKDYKHLLEYLLIHMELFKVKLIKQRLQ